MYVKEVFGSCRLNVTVSLSSLRHCSKVERGVESVDDFGRSGRFSRLFRNLKLVVIVAAADVTYVIGACLSNFKLGYVK